MIETNSEIVAKMPSCPTLPSPFIAADFLQSNAEIVAWRLAQGSIGRREGWLKCDFRTSSTIRQQAEDRIVAIGAAQQKISAPDACQKVDVAKAHFAAAKNNAAETAKATVDSAVGGAAVTSLLVVIALIIGAASAGFGGVAAEVSSPPQWTNPTCRATHAELRDDFPVMLLRSNKGHDDGKGILLCCWAYIFW